MTEGEKVKVPSTLKDQFGVFARWFESRGFGFISCEGKDYFVHRKSLPEGVHQHQRVLFDVRDNTADKTGKACNVRPVEGLRGVVKLWNEKGYGFIGNPSGGKDLFFHAASLPRGIEQVEKGMSLMFDLDRDKKTNKMQAVKVRIEGFERPQTRERDRDYFERERRAPPSEGRYEREYREERRMSSRFEREPVFRRPERSSYERSSYDRPSERSFSRALPERESYREPAYRREEESYGRRMREESYGRPKESFRTPEESYRRPEESMRRPVPSYGYGREEPREAPMRGQRRAEGFKKQPWQSSYEEKLERPSYNRISEPKRSYYSQF